MKSFLLILISFVLWGCGGASGGSGVFEVPSLPEKSQDLSANVEGSSSIFVGYDDTGSSALVQLMKYEINHDQGVDPNLVNPHELLNAEKFVSEEMITLGDFKISVGLLPSESKESGKTVYDLGVHLQSTFLTTEERPNFVLTYCIDTSGSMSAGTGAKSLSTKTKITLIKEGLIASLNMLKTGDVISIVTFSDGGRILVENYIQGISDEEILISKINSINSGGTTNIESGLKLAYKLATKYHDTEKKSRVILATDALANEGHTDPTFIADNIIVNNKKGILLSGIGIGFDYEATFLEELTDAGAGNQFLLATDADAEYIFSEGFLPLLMVAAKDLKVEIQYPSSLSHIASAAEQTAATAEELKGINFNFNSEQFFLERFKTDSENEISSKEITINLTYIDPNTNEDVALSQTFVIGDILNLESSNIKDALTMIFLTSLIKKNKTWEDLQWEFGHVLSGHSSALYTEYRGLIFNYAGKKDEDAF